MAQPSLDPDRPQWNPDDPLPKRPEHSRRGRSERTALALTLVAVAAIVVLIIVL
jgi:hypothetical protein